MPSQMQEQQENSFESTSAKVLKQVEFYFGDSNYARDKFLQEQAKKEEQGWIPLETIMSFNRMKTLTQDADLIVKVLREGSELVEVSEDGKLVRRALPLPEDKDFNDRSIYAVRTTALLCARY